MRTLSIICTTKVDCSLPRPITNSAALKLRRTGFILYDIRAGQPTQIHI